MLEGCVTVAVVGRPLLRVLQRFVGFVDFLELVLGAVIVRILVRMVLHGQLAEGAFQLFFVRRLGDTQRFVKVRFCHRIRPRKWISGCHGEQPECQFLA